MFARRHFLKVGLAGIGFPALGFAASDNRGAEFRFTFLTDVHAMLEREAPSKMREMAGRIADLDLGLIVGGGDFVHGGYTSTPAEMEPRFAVLRDFLNRVGHRVEAVLGNHDLVGVAPADGSPPVADPARMFRETFGLKTTRRTFEHAGYRFLVVDSVELLPDRNAYRGWIGEGQRKWLAKELAATPFDQPLILCSHVPLGSMFYQEVDGPMAAMPPNLIVGDASEVLALFAKHDLRLVLQGHLHVNEMLRWNHRLFVTGGAVSGAWWNGANRGTPPGFGTLTPGSPALAWDYLNGLAPAESADGF